ncbi:MAG: hypothetical protein ACI3Z7_05225 [Candidatus Aphodosoma sp.]
MEPSVLLNYIFGGGLLAAVIGVVTLRSTVVKANAEAEKARAEAESVRFDNAGKATRILIENIVEPLKTELSDTRKELFEAKKEFGSTKREMARLRKSVEAANSCRYSNDCPVLYMLRCTTKESRRNASAVQQRPRGQPCQNDSDGEKRACTGVGNGNHDTDAGSPLLARGSGMPQPQRTG